MLGTPSGCWEPPMGCWEPKSSLPFRVTRLRGYAYVIVESIVPVSVSFEKKPKKRHSKRAKKISRDFVVLRRLRKHAIILTQRSKIK